MAKKLISVWLSLTILLFSSISIIYADEVIQGDFFLKNIVINGENIVNYKLSNPILLYNDSTYIPMDTTMGCILGFEAELDNESRTLKILKTEPTQTNLVDQTVKNNLEDVTAVARYDIDVVAYTEAQNKDARLNGEQADATGSDQNDEGVSLFKRALEEFSIFGMMLSAVDVQSNLKAEELEEIQVPEMNQVQIDLKGQAVLVRNDIVYVPLNTIVSSETLGWTSYYDDYAGVYISTDDEIDAASYFNASESNYYAGLTAYVVKRNPKLSKSQALEMVKYFEAYGQIYGVDLELLMSLAQSESCYTSDICNSYNCCGLMQIKVSTGANYGLTKAELLQVKPNIQMGTMLIGENLKTFGGDVVKALAAYNYGTYAVQKGKYTTGYAYKVIERAASIEAFANSYA
jgi:hypothetical protein